MEKDSKILKFKSSRPRFKVKATKVHPVKNKHKRKVKHKKNLTNETGG